MPLKAHDLTHTDQFGFELVLAVSVTQASVAPLAPGVEFSAGCDAGAVSSTGSDIHHLYPSQRLDHPRTVTRTEEGENTHAQEEGKTINTTFPPDSVPRKKKSFR